MDASEWEIPSEVLERCHVSNILSVDSTELVMAPTPDDPRDQIALAACRLAHEHHSSIVTLVKSSHYASAVALIRPLIEAVLTASWAAYVLGIDRAQHLLTEDGSSIPTPRELWKVCICNPQIGIGVKAAKAMMDREGRIFHKFTHGDMEQLKRRVEMQPPFAPVENIATLLNADLILVLAMCIAANATQFTGVASKYEPYMRSLLRESGERFGTLQPEPPPFTGFPQPLRL